MPDRPILGLSDFPTPEGSARRERLDGADLVLADGRSWTLAEFVPRPDAVWDRLFDDNVIAREYRVRDVRIAGAWLLLANYDLPADCAVWLIGKADAEPLARIVEGALFGRPGDVRGWSDWVRSAFWSNGIDPDSIPPSDRNLVLDQLVATGRAVALMRFTTAGIASARRKSLADRFAAAGIRPTPYKPPAETPAPADPS